MKAADWIDSARSLAQSSSIPLGVPVAVHMDMLLRDTRRDLRTAADALEKVLELHERVDAPDAFCLPCQSLTDTYWPCPTVAAINEALGVES